MATDRTVMSCYILRESVLRFPYKSRLFRTNIRTFREN